MKSPRPCGRRTAALVVGSCRVTRSAATSAGAGATQNAAPAVGPLALDLDLVGTRELELRRVDFEDPLLELRLHVLRVGLRGKMEAALEGLLETLPDTELLLRDLLLCLGPLALHDERVIRDLDAELLPLEARHLQLDDELVLRLIYVRRREDGRSEADVFEEAAHRRLQSLELAEGRPPDDRGHVVTSLLIGTLDHLGARGVAHREFRCGRSRRTTGARRRIHRCGDFVCARK